MPLQDLISEAWRVTKYYLKFFMLLLWMLSTFIIIPFMYRKPGHYKNKVVLYYYAAVICKILGIRWTEKGVENIVADGGSVVVMNHQSMIDIFATKSLAKLKVFTHCVVKKEIWYLLPLAIVFWLTGSIFINRSNKKQAMETMNKLPQAIIKDKNRLIVFPEGTRNQGFTDGFLPFKKGAFYAAISAQAPIQPIVIQKYKFLDHQKHRFDEGETVISILPPIPMIGLKKEDVNSLIQKTTEIMLKEYEALNKSH
ncbi:unnamed protein product [Nezara viridula]|uniref:1-acyl-sn-glycerol-3-phosphate acyltransferase n=1 Tax=Nezara viridula TaxID=85310 RepID=A0A9P0MT84_NEZVI|nr:unnamed protein product [Nezara viridula]